MRMPIVGAICLGVGLVVGFAFGRMGVAPAGNQRPAPVPEGITTQAPGAGQEQPPQPQPDRSLTGARRAVEGFLQACADNDFERAKAAWGIETFSNGFTTFSVPDFIVEGSSEFARFQVVEVMANGAQALVYCASKASPLDGLWLRVAPMRGRWRIIGMEDRPAPRTSQRRQLSLDSIRCTGLRFFEAGATAPPKEQRGYHTRFSQSAARFIYWEVHFAFPAAASPYAFPLRAVFTRPDGSTLAEQKAEAKVESGWTGYYHWQGWGWSEPGKWQPGAYQVTVYSGQRRLASEGFSIN